MKAGDNQADKLPTTTSSVVTESKGTFAGLDGMGFFAVMLSFVLVMMVANMFTEHGIIFGIASAVVMYFIMRTYISGKPDGFLMDLILFFSRPKLFEHQPRDKRPVLKDDIKSKQD